MIKLTIKYALFAGISTIGNLSTQRLVLMLLTSLGFLKGFEEFSFLGIFKIDLLLITAILFGTLVGLVIKYVLDKKYIFNFETKSNAENTGKFLLYSFMGIFTTLIYWAFEISFDSFFGTDSAKYVGAIIGLTIGYVIKYNLDKRFVFNHK
ncbi:GtrA family protein [Acetivibrio cellulolyticus]|uniref:GtrA family protein n=1 Tax=Acetivibrio cellulolyticus TaxID=35830 RepID=UPI0001E2E7A0|nr:GtrA family protein [Acetivibrio cellulolyticus]